MLLDLVNVRKLKKKEFFFFTTDGNPIDNPKQDKKPTCVSPPTRPTQPYPTLPYPQRGLEKLASSMLYWADREDPRDLVE